MQSTPNNQSPSFESQKALKDLESLGYDIAALIRMKMNDERIVDLRNKAFQYRGIQVQDPVSKHDGEENNAAQTKIQVVSNKLLETPEDNEAGMVERILYLAEKELCDD